MGGGAGLFVFNDTIEGPRSPAVKPSQGASLKPDESGSMGGQAGLRADADCRCAPVTSLLQRDGGGSVCLRQDICIPAILLLLAGCVSWGVASAGQATAADGFPMSAHLSRLRLFQRHFAELGSNLDLGLGLGSHSSSHKVAGEVVGENSGWKIKLVVFVGGTCGSVHVQTFNNNLKELGVLESKRHMIRRGLVHELLHAQDTVLCSYFAQRSGARGEGWSRDSTVEEAFQGLDHFE